MKQHKRNCFEKTKVRWGIFKKLSPTNLHSEQVAPLAANGLQLGEVAEIEAQMFSFAQKFNRRTAVEFSTEPAILPNCCSSDTFGER